MAHPNNRHSRSRAQPVDCATCLATHRCWEGTVTANSGFRVKRRAVLEKGTMLFQQGERFAGAHIVVTGSLKLRETDERGRERIVTMRLPNELVGMEGWARGRYPYTAEAATPTKVCQLQWPHGKDCAPSTALLERLLRKTAVQVEHSTHVWMNLPAIERVAAFLDHFVQHARPSSELPITRAEIGSLLGLAEETVVRAIAQLRAQQRVEMQGRRIARVVREPQR